MYCKSPYLTVESASWGFVKFGILLDSGQQSVRVEYLNFRYSRADTDSDSQREDAIRDYNRRIQELTREFHRDVADLRRQEAREREAIARQTAAREVQIAEQAQAEKARIAQEKAAARAQAQEDIASAEEAAGVSFSEAQENYIPALSAHEQALLAHAEALRRSRSSPNYLPDANQIRNAKDVSREIVAGVTEGLEIGNRRDGGLGDASQQASLPEEIVATVVVEFPDGSVQELADQVLRLREQDRTNL